MAPYPSTNNTMLTTHPTQELKIHNHTHPPQQLTTSITLPNHSQPQSPYSDHF